MQLVTRAVHQVRGTENAELLRQGDTRLKGTRYLWGYSDENVPKEQRERLEQLKAGALKTGRAYALKEFLRTLWTCPTKKEAQEVFLKWAGWAQRSRLDPMIDLARRLHARLYNLLTFVEHRITNALSEGLNSALSTLLRRAYGYRNLDNQITALYFHQGRLNMLPELAGHGDWG